MQYHVVLCCVVLCCMTVCQYISDEDWEEVKKVARMWLKEVERGRDMG